jgi:hypothetical protein
MSLVLNVEILGEFKKLTAATQGASKQLSGLQGTAQKISSSIGRAFATIGVGLGFAVITRELKEATKAAVEDAKSQGLLAKALQNTTGANQQQIGSVENAITKMSLQAAVADDQLRPAFAQLARATGDVQKSTELMELALDVSAGTGKSLDTVVRALSRAVGPDGTTGALERLAPAIKGASDPLAELERLFGGSAQKAAELDPYQRLKIAFDEISESVGVMLIPVVEEFADWLVDVLPKVQKFFEELNDPTTEMGEKWQGMINIMDLTGQKFDELMDIFSGGKSETNMVMDWITSLTAGLGQILFYLGKLGQAWNAFWAGDFAEVARISQNYLKDYAAFIRAQNQALLPSQEVVLPGQSPFGGRAREGGIVINVNSPNMTANDIVNALNRARRADGSQRLP